MLKGPLATFVNNTSTFAYITNQTNNSPSALTICPIMSNGLLGSTCSNTTGNNTINSPGGLTINPNNTQLYVSNNGSNTVSICPLQANGSLGTCVADTAGGIFSVPNDVFIF